MMGNVIYYTVHMCTMQGKYCGEEKESTERSVAWAVRATTCLALAARGPLARRWRRPWQAGSPDGGRRPGPHGSRLLRGHRVAPPRAGGQPLYLYV